MKITNIEVDVNVLNIDIIENLVELIEKHWEDMPKDLRDIINDAYENGFGDYTTDDFINDILKRDLYFPNITTSIRDDDIVKNKDLLIGDNGITKVNKWLKRIYLSDGTILNDVEHFWIKADDTIVYEW